MSYFQWLAIFWGIPLASLFILSPKILFNYKGLFSKILVGTIFIGLPADIIAVNFGLWTFPQGLSKLYFLSVPIEEYFWTFMYVSIVIYLTLLLLEKKIL